MKEFRDLDDLRVEFINEQFKNKATISYEDVVSECPYAIVPAINSVLSEFYQDRRGKEMNKHALMYDLNSIAKWIATLIYVLDVEVMEVSDIDEFSREFLDEFHNDGVLSSMQLLAALHDLLGEHYTEDEPQEELLEQSLAEMLASIHMIAKRIGSNLQEVLDYRA